MWSFPNGKCHDILKVSNMSVITPMANIMIISLISDLRSHGGNSGSYYINNAGIYIYIYTRIGKACSVGSLQRIHNLKEWCTDRARVIITSFVRVVDPLKYPSNASLSCLDNGPCYWNAIWVSNVIGVIPVSRWLTKIKHSNISQASNIANMPLSNNGNQPLNWPWHELWTQISCNNYRVFFSVITSQVM